MPLDRVPGLDWSQSVEDALVKSTAVAGPRRAMDSAEVVIQRGFACLTIRLGRRGAQPYVNGPVDSREIDHEEPVAVSFHEKPG